MRPDWRLLTCLFLLLLLFVRRGRIMWRCLDVWGFGGLFYFPMLCNSRTWLLLMCWRFALLNVWVVRTCKSFGIVPGSHSPWICSLFLGGSFSFRNNLPHSIEIFRHNYLLSITEVHLHIPSTFLCSVRCGFLSAIDLIISFTPLNKL